MRRALQLSGVLAFVLVLVIVVVAAVRDDQDREQLWKQVEKAQSEGLPKTAVKHLDAIIKSAVDDEQYDEAIKAISLKIVLEANIQGNKPEERVKRMEQAIQDAPMPMKPVMQAILANWYWQYYQQNRWRFSRRSRTEQAPSEDFTTWDSPRLMMKIGEEFDTALANEQWLKETKVTEFSKLLLKGNVPDSYRPTMYDFVANNAVDFYSNVQASGARSQDAFDLSADGPIFAETDEFRNWKVETTDTDSPIYKSVRLYQDLLTFHAEDPAPAPARVDADLQRLRFGFNHAFGPEKNARYKAALERFVDKHEDHPISTRAIHQLASVVHGEGDWVKAHEIARRGTARFTDSIGFRRCKNLISQIEARQVQVDTERVWNDPLPKIRVSYRNLERVYFRIVPFDFDRWITTNKSSTMQLNNQERAALLAKRPAVSWSWDLPATEDYQMRDFAAEPDKMPPAGSYFLLSSANKSFSDEDNQVLFTQFWVSDLALILRPRNGAGMVEGFVLQADSGKPIKKATVRSWTRGRRGFVNRPVIRTDQNGMFKITGNRESVVIMAEHKKQRVATGNAIGLYTYNYRPKERKQTVFFTDRAIYRPGQTIQYKGISFSLDPQSNKYSVMAGHRLTVTLLDVNGKEIEKQDHRSNDYGSFSGSFTAPRDRLLGRMTIRCQGTAPGVASVRVEEYKRPKFQVAIEPPEEPAKLKREVAVVGKATAYTGAPIDGAKVRWRVVRQVIYPRWWSYRYWWNPSPSANQQEIAHGSAITESDGTFEVKFTAKPDLSVDRESEPTFNFTVFADVTDTAGETRANQRTVRVGYTTLAANLSANDWQQADKPVQVTVRTTTLDGEGKEAEGKLAFFELLQPEQVQRAALSAYRYRWMRQPPKSDPSNPMSWEKGPKVMELPVATDGSGNALLDANLSEGFYKAVLTTQDEFGQAVTAELLVRVLDPEADRLSLKVPHLVAAPTWSVEPGESLDALWGTGYAKGQAFVEIEHRGKILKSYWTDADVTQHRIRHPVDESLRGGFTMRVTYVRENRAYIDQRSVTVPWTNKQLTVKWEHFVSKLKPAQEETWSLVISPPECDEEDEADAVQKLAAEMVATLYDASLDAFTGHSWSTLMGYFYRDYCNANSQFQNYSLRLSRLRGNWNRPTLSAQLLYRRFDPAITVNMFGFQWFSRNRGLRGGGAPGAPSAGAMPSRMAKSDAEAPSEGAEAQSFDAGGAPDDSRAMRQQSAGQAAAQPDLSQVTARKNLNETAFFFPQVSTSADGVVRIEFTMPEALTEWKFIGLVHDREMRSGILQDKAVTSKELMIQPNPPRFVREGDLLEFTVKVSNQSASRQTGTVRLTMADARTTDSVDHLLDNAETDKEFDVPAGESRSYSWRIVVPDDLGFLTYKAVGSTGRLSDGEEGFLPVLSRRILVTESLPLPIRGAQTKKFEFDRLRKAAESDSLRHKSLTVQMVSQPAWYAVMALPYLMEYPYECTEQTFNRLYANSLARHIAQSDPKIARIFELWRNTEALDSPLEKNEDLKAVMLEETPWVRQADSESQARRNVGILFDDNRLDLETKRILRKLAELQLDDGGWSWFPGGRANDYITLYIMTGFGRLRHLGVDIDTTMAQKATARLDAWIHQRYLRIVEKKTQDQFHLTPMVAMYLYGRSFFLEERPIQAVHRPAVDFFRKQARERWLQLANRQSQGHLALAHHRFGDRESARKIMRSIKERSVEDEELGMFWRDTERSWWWYRAPIETQAVMIEAFDEVMNDQEAVEGCRVWLLKQKQTQDWKTTKATADACYGLLLRGTDALASDVLVEVSLGDVLIKPEKVEAGTGFYERRFIGSEINADLATVKVVKQDEGVSWGSVHWQYLEDMSKITPYEGTPLKLRKKIFTKENTTKGPVLKAIEDHVEVGDQLVVRIELEVDRDMEYVHLKDYRGSGTEPVDVLSHYRYQDGLAYYQMTRDTASHFFIDYLPKGKYVFEYSVRVQLKGEYQSGIAQIQCMYAPEFNSHSESLELKVQ